MFFDPIKAIVDLAKPKLDKGEPDGDFLARRLEAREVWDWFIFSL